MLDLKAVYFYLVAVKITLIRFFKKIYFGTNYYNKSLETKLPNQIYFYPNSFLLSSFVNQKNFTFRLSQINVNTFWTEHANIKEEKDLNSFFWLNLINRKSDGLIIQEIFLFG